MSRYVVAFCVVLGMASLGAQNKEQSRLENCGVVMEEILNVPDNIPQELLGKAECVIVIPSMMKVAVGIGASYGRGAMAVSYTHLRAHETRHDLVCRLLL